MRFMRRAASTRASRSITRISSSLACCAVRPPDLLEALALLLHQPLELDRVLLRPAPRAVRPRLRACAARLAALERPILAGEVVVELGDAALLLVELGRAASRPPSRTRCCAWSSFSLACELALAQLGRHLPLGVLEDARRLDLGLLLLLGRDAPDEDQPDERRGDGGRDDRCWQ
jgi:hypothetical protein